MIAIKHIIKCKLGLVFFLFAHVASTHSQVQDSEISAKLWEAMGGEANWDSARFFMFSCVGGQQAFVVGERKYLWDKQKGDCRFEGTTTDDEQLTVLFNIKTAAGKAYVNGAQLNSAQTNADIVNEVVTLFEQDARLLFLPAAIDGDRVSYNNAEEKLIGTQRFIVVDLTGGETGIGTEIDGRLYLDAQTGQIQQWVPKQGTTKFSVAGFKDIGGGLVLPTQFTSTNPASSVSYPLAAALVHIEAQQFHQP